VRSGRSCTAAFVASDIQALGALEVAREQHVAVPQDLAIIGFDDIELAEHADLTTMRQPLSEMGKLSMDRLVARMHSASLPPMLKEFTPELVVRRSSGALPMSAGRAAGIAEEASPLSAAR
jgi:DNA-binding LacI/PurR family transcriptional regulator